VNATYGIDKKIKIGSLVYQTNKVKSTEHEIANGARMYICTRPCAALLIFPEIREPWRSDGEVPAYSWKLRKYVWVRFEGAQDESLPARIRGKCHS
jgi:hypothetical protein